MKISYLIFLIILFSSIVYSSEVLDGLTYSIADFRYCRTNGIGCNITNATNIVTYTNFTYNVTNNITINQTQINYLTIETNTQNATFGSMWQYNETSPTVITIPDSEVYHNITGFHAGNLSKITYNNNALTITEYGFYKVHFSISFSGGGNNNYGITISVNEVPQMETYIHRKLGTGGDVGNAGGTGIFWFNPNDQIRLVVEDENLPPANINVWMSNVVITKLEVAAYNDSALRDAFYNVSGDTLEGTMNANNQSIDNIKNLSVNQYSTFKNDVNISNDLYVHDDIYFRTLDSRFDFTVDKDYIFIYQNLISFGVLDLPNVADDWRIQRSTDIKRKNLNISHVPGLFTELGAIVTNTNITSEKQICDINGCIGDGITTFNTSNICYLNETAPFQKNITMDSTNSINDRDSNSHIQFDNGNLWVILG